MYSRYVMCHLRLYRIQQSVHFSGVALDDQVNSSVGQIPHEAGHLEPRGQCPDSITEPDALHFPRVMHLTLLHD